jgi:hypothetical protein
MNYPYDPDVFLRDNIVLGDPDSGFQEISLSQLRQYLKWLERSGPSVIASSEEELADILGDTQNKKAEVRGAENKSENGYYSWDEDTQKWVKRASLDLTFGQLVDIKGSSQEIRATLIGSVESGHAVAMVGTALHTNVAGGTFIKIDGVREEILGPSGEQLGDGYFVAGKAFLLTRNADGSLRCSFSGDAVGSAQQAATSAATAVAMRDEVLSLANVALSGGSAQVLSTLKAAELLDLPAGVTEFWVNGNEAAGDGGEGLITYEPSETDLPNILYAPAKVGRFKRNAVGELKASQVGIVDSPTLDQGEKFQDFLNVTTYENLSPRLDRLHINCGASDGRIMFWNEGGDANGIRLNSAVMTGVGRRDTRLINCFLSVGDQNSLNTAASVLVSMSNIHLEGAARFLNVEGILKLEDTTFFTSPLVDYSSVPDDWALNGDTYPAFGHILELIECNHPRVDNVAVQNGIDATGIEGGIGACLMANCGNLLWAGGRMNRNRSGLSYDANAVTGGGGSRKAFIQGIHFEDTVENAVRLRGISQAYVDCHVQAENTWDHENHAMLRIEGATARAIHVSGWFNGPGNGTAIDADDGSLITIDGQYMNLDVVARVDVKAVNISFGKIDLINVPETTAFDIDPRVARHLPRVREAGLVHSVGANRMIKRVSDDFTGVQLDTSRFLLSEGTDAAALAEVVAGQLQLNTGAGSPSDTVTNAIQVTTGAAFRCDSGRMDIEGYVGFSSSACRLFFGFTDDGTTLELPVTVVGGAASSQATDAVGFVNSGTELYAVSVKAGAVQSALLALNISPFNSRELSVSVNGDGDAIYWVDGEFAAEITGAVSVDVNYASFFGGEPTSAATRQLRLSRIAAQCRVAE